MSFVKNFVIFLIYINSLSYALQCTTDCFFSVNLNTPFEVPINCNQTTSAKQCQFYVSISSSYIFVSFSALSSTYLLNDNHFAMIQLTDSGSMIFSYSISHQCKNIDDCAREFAKNNMPNILQRPPINYQAIENELLPLLLSNSSIERTDLSCFDSNENVRQCAVGTKSGACQLTHQLTDKKKTVTRSCKNELIGNPQQVSISDSGDFAYFGVQCNRSLCNGHLTLQAVKEIMFKYNVTKTIEGRLNHGLRLSFSFMFLILITLFLLFI